MPYGERLDEALVYASKLHREQTRKGTEIPYLMHLLSVAALVGEAGGDEDEVIAAILHDAVEDQGGAPVLKAIGLQFGQRVADIVAGCTDTDQTPKPPWRARKEAYIAHLAEADRSVLLVSMADKLHNARSIVSDLRHDKANVWSKFTGGRDGTLWYYQTIVTAYERLGPSRMHDELKRTVEEMVRLS